MLQPESCATPAQIGAGRPTKEELLADYPSKFTWQQLKTFINSGDLGLLKRDKNLQQRYNIWLVGIKERYGSSVNYLLNHRLQWGRPDTISLLTSALDTSVTTTATYPITGQLPGEETRPTPSVSHDVFTVNTPPELISIIQNDWPYSVPPEVEHTLVWTKASIMHPSLISPKIAARVDQDGLWGFTGTDEPPPSPSTLSSCLPALSDWGVTLDSMVCSTPPTEEEKELLGVASREVDRFVKSRWAEGEWETAWFVNPPRLQSVPGLAHIHVFARKKLVDELSRDRL